MLQNWFLLAAKVVGLFILVMRDILGLWLLNQTYTTEFL